MQNGGRKGLKKLRMLEGIDFSAFRTVNFDYSFNAVIAVYVFVNSRFGPEYICKRTWDLKQPVLKILTFMFYSNLKVSIIGLNLKVLLLKFMKAKVIQMHSKWILINASLKTTLFCLWNCGVSRRNRHLHSCHPPIESCLTNSSHITITDRAWVALIRLFCTWNIISFVILKLKY